MKKAFYLIFTKSVGIYLNLLSFASIEKANLMAFSLFSQPRKGKILSGKMPKTLEKAVHKKIKHNGEEIATYIWEGNETIILLIHGWESNSSRWKKTLPYLQATGSTIIALDAPAHGLSSGKEFTIPKYAEWIDIVVKEYKPKFLIGHSFGGQTCLYYQSHYQSTSIEKIVILGAPNDFKTILHNYTSLLKLNDKITKSLENKYTQIFQRELSDFTGQNFAATVKTKGLIVHDIDDTVVLFEQSKTIASAWKNAAFIETKGLGHGLHDEILYTQVISFLFDDQQ
ncbi:alpha/beta hydrolase [Flavobacterium algicola]|uniref:alpha/beta hydrolase n=1 Tax=Flavobacterium algicola TaxID=556529 RepID=UPI001EFD7C2F|nr:alpha/beta fold hydrolase [Flavobacterium algicola]MCG9793015.1 alpha/beta hydrolase [Flavobacterium algicola]